MRGVKRDTVPPFLGWAGLRLKKLAAVARKPESGMTDNVSRPDVEN